MMLGIMAQVLITSGFSFTVHPAVDDDTEDADDPAGHRYGVVLRRAAGSVGSGRAGAEEIPLQFLQPRLGIAIGVEAVVGQPFQLGCAQQLALDYKVEGALALLHWFRRLRIRWERCDDIHEAFLTLGCAIICWRRLRTALCRES
jgi:hypothetical protein